MGPESALRDLAFVFSVLFGAALLAGFLRQSVVPFYIIAGIGLQPLVDESAAIGVFALIGVSVLLFVIGLEFSVTALARSARPLISAGAWDLVVNFAVGTISGLAIGLAPLAAVAFGAAFYISSSVIVAKSIVDNRMAANPEVGPALGVIVFEDLFIALFLAVFTGVAAAGQLAGGALALTLAKTVVFVAGLLLLARPLARPLGRLIDLADDERLVVLLFALLTSFAAAAHALSLSEAIGAFLAGVIVAGTNAKARVERIVVPYQQLFAALFFVAFGLLVDLTDLRAVWPIGVAIAIVGLGSKMATGFAIGRVRSLSRLARVRLGILLAPRGEFSILIAGSAVALGVAGADRLAAIVAVYVLVLSVTAPLLLPHSEAIARGFRRSED